MKIEALCPLLVRLPESDLPLVSGQVVELPEPHAHRLLTQAPDMVRLASGADPTVLEPAASTVRPVYWVRGDESIVGPATVTHFAKTGTGNTAQFWVVVEYAGRVVWIRDDRLRTRRQFDEHRPLREVELIRERK